MGVSQQNYLADPADPYGLRRTPAMRRARLGVQRRLKRLLFRAEPSVRRLPFGLPRGLCLEVDLRGYWYGYLGLYEIEIAAHIRELCRPGSCCYDIGTQNGYYALILARLSGRRVVAIDADQAVMGRIQRVMQANPAWGELVDVRIAYVGSGAEGSLALDDIAYEGHGNVPDLIKIDIEGGEVEALRGAGRMLSDHRPHLIIETHSTELERQCLELLADHRYQTEIVHRRTWLREDRPLPHNRWLVARGDQPRS
jgi:methyltransferase FkbM-like protein